jgi:four helix bundle protein
MGMIARHYRELDCWQLSNELKKRIYAFLATMPAKNDFDFCKQIRGSARGAPRTIAEGFGRFRPRDFARYLEFARASLMETQNHLDDALEMRYISQQEHRQMFVLAKRAIGATGGLHRYLRTCDPTIGELTIKTRTRDMRTQNQPKRRTLNQPRTENQEPQNQEPRNQEPRNQEPENQNQPRTKNPEP